MKYWALINNVKVGPLTVDQLKAVGMTRDTLMWREGLPQWIPAWQVPELMPMFQPANGTNINMPPCPSTHLAWAVVLTLLCCLPAGIVAIVYSSSVETKYAHGDYAGAQRASQNALTWCIVSLVLGLISAPLAIFTGMPFNWIA